METNKRKNLVLILMFILLIINISMMITFLVFTKSKDHFDKFDKKDKKMKHKGKIECMMKDLQLSEQQKDTFFQLRNTHKEAIKTLFKEVGSERNMMINAIASEPPLTVEELYPFAQKMGKIEVKIQIEKIKYFLKMRELLEPIQFNILIENFRDICACPYKKDKHKSKKHKHDKCDKYYKHDKCDKYYKYDKQNKHDKSCKHK